MSKELVAGIAHVVPVWAPVSAVDTANSGDLISMKGWDHITFIIQFSGATTSGADRNITVQGSTAASAGSTADFATINYRVMSTTDTWGSLAQVTDSKLDYVSGGEIALTDIAVAIEVDAEELKAASTTYDLKFITVNIDAGSGTKTTVSSCIAILTRGRYHTDVPLTAIA